MTDETTAVEASAEAGFSKEQLESWKLQEEIAKTQLESQELELKIARSRHEYDWAMARPMNAGGHGGLEYTFTDPVYSDSVDNCISTLNVWSRKWPGEPITLVINSPGGSIFDGLALYDYLQGLKARGHLITTRCIGMAASMAGVLLQAGDVREAGRNSYVLIHEASTIARGKGSAIEDEWKLLQRLQGKIIAILSERSKLSPETIEHNWQRKDWWLDAAECLELGLVDRVA